MANKITSVAQMVNSYHVAEVIYNQRESGTELISNTDFKFMEKWGIKTPDPRKKELYKKVVSALRGNIKLCVIAKICLEEMDSMRFDTFASVSSNQNDNKNIRSIYSSMEFSALKNVDLNTHSLNVLEEVLDELSEKDVYGSGPAVIACILHDFGKAKKVRELATPDSVSENSSKFRMHPEVSSIYVRDVLYEKVRKTLLDAKEDPNIRKTIDGIAELVANHHNSSKAWKKKVGLINVADSKARKRELAELDE